MAFIGEVNFKEGRTPSKSITLVLEQCLGCPKPPTGVEIEKFFTALKIKPGAFFRDIDADWPARPFIGQHAFKIVQTAGYEGTEHDLWVTVTGNEAPYAVKQAKKPAPVKVKVKAPRKIKKTS